MLTRRMVGTVVVDLIAYKDDKIMESLYMKELMREDKPGEAFHLGGEVRRYVLPLNAERKDLITPHTTAAAPTENSGQNVLEVIPEILLPAEVGVELPVINYRQFNGRKYRFFYGLGIGRQGRDRLDIVKFDVEKKKEIVWSQKHCFPGSSTGENTVFFTDL